MDTILNIGTYAICAFFIISAILVLFTKDEERLQKTMIITKMIGMSLSLIVIGALIYVLSM